MFVFILRVKGAEVNEQNSDSENEDHEDSVQVQSKFYSPLIT